MRVLSGRHPCPSLLYPVGAAGSGVGGSLEESSIAVGDPLAWGCRECRGGFEVVDTGSCISESITTRFRSWQRAVRDWYSLFGFLVGLV